MNYEKFFRKAHINIQKGLSIEEIENIQNVYNIIFPVELRNLLCHVVPCGDGFCNWRDLSSENVAFLNNRMHRPIEDIQVSISELYWNDEWGDEIADDNEKKLFLLKKLSESPRLIPIYYHRYIPMIEGVDVPIISVCNTDVIYYGKNLDDYLEIEFGEKSQAVLVNTDMRKIPFWTEIM